jgi:hypothetical protein
MLNYKLHAVIGLLVLGCIKLSAATIVVNPGASAIQNAITAASNGDTLSINDGVYTENLTINKQLILKGVNRDNAQIVGISHAISADNIQLLSLNFRGDSGSGTATRIINCPDVGRTGLVISNCYIFGTNQGYPLDGSSSCVYLYNGYKALLISNTCFGLTPFGIHKGFNTGSSRSIDNTYANGVQIIGNTFTNLSEDAIDIHGQWITVEGNSIMDCISTNWANNHPDGIQGIRSANTTLFITNVTHCIVRRNKIRNVNQAIFFEGDVPLVSNPATNNDEPCSDITIVDNEIWSSGTVVNGVDMGAFNAMAGIVLNGCANSKIWNNSIGYLRDRNAITLNIIDVAFTGINIRGNIFDTRQGTGFFTEHTNFIRTDFGGALNYNFYGVNAGGSSSGNDIAIASSGGFNPTLASFKADPRYGQYENNGLDGDPLYVSATDHRLQSTSTARGASIVTDVAYKVDIAGTDRGTNPPWDMGAYSFTTGSGGGGSGTGGGDVPTNSFPVLPTISMLKQLLFY